MFIKGRSMKKKYPSPGDSGKCKLPDGKICPKSHIKFEVSGTLDELSSIIGWTVTVCKIPELKESLTEIQKMVFIAGSTLAGWKKEKFPKELTSRLEDKIKEFSKSASVDGFILPGGSELACRLHIARTVCRKLERRIALLNEKEEKVEPEILTFINRLSDFLFAAALYANAKEGIKELKIN